MARALQAPEKSAGDPPPATPKRLKRAKRDPEFDVALGAHIRAARLAAGMSQGALGEAVGISYQQMHKYETGKDRVAANTLQGIAAALGVRPGSFFDKGLPAPVESTPDVRAVMALGQRIQSVRDPALAKRLLALADALTEALNEEKNGQPSVISAKAP